MGVSTTTNRKDYVGTGTTGPFPYDFYIFEAADMEVWTTDASGIPVQLTSAEYTITGVGLATGGSVTTVAAVPVGYPLALVRVLSYTQPFSFTDLGDFFASQHEAAFDRVTMLIQQLAELTGRGITMPITFTESATVEGAPTIGYAVGVTAAGTLGFVPNTGADQTALMADQVSASNGAGRVGFTYALSYAAGTVGKAIKDVMDRATAVEGRATALEATDALDLLKHQIQTITATVASSALTVGLAPTTLDFRSATLGSGVVNTRTLASAASVVVPSTATLGTVNAVQSRIVVLALDNAGTIELAVVNLAGGNNLDETTLISTTAISTASDAANVAYSTTARTNLPFRVVGYIESTQATAGTWATAPSAIQGAGGKALAASGLGYGQTWQDVTSSRVINTLYYNTTGKPIHVTIRVTATNSSTAARLEVDGLIVAAVGQGTTNVQAMLYAIIPPGSSYKLPTMTNETLNSWFELR